MRTRNNPPKRRVANISNVKTRQSRRISPRTSDSSSTLSNDRSNASDEKSADSERQLPQTKKQKSLSQYSTVDWTNLGGLSDHIQIVKETVLLPIIYPIYFEKIKIQPPRGILFYGPPGTGKTLMARAICTECAKSGVPVKFFIKNCGDILSKFVGESEKKLRNLFVEARENGPSIIFLDELDGLAPMRNSKSEAIHGSIVATLLSLMDGLEDAGRVVVIGATNRPGSLDPALRRPGRFDKELYFPLPSVSQRAEILSIHTKNWHPTPPSKDFLTVFAERLHNFSGADIRGLCTETVLRATRSQNIIKMLESITVNQIAPPRITKEDLEECVATYHSSAERLDPNHVTSLPSNFWPLVGASVLHLHAEICNVYPLGYPPLSKEIEESSSMKNLNSWLVVNRLRKRIPKTDSGVHAFLAQSTCPPPPISGGVPSWVVKEKDGCSFEDLPNVVRGSDFMQRARNVLQSTGVSSSRRLLISSSSDPSTTSKWKMLFSHTDVNRQSLISHFSGSLCVVRCHCKIAQDIFFSTLNRFQHLRQFHVTVEHAAPDGHACLRTMFIEAQRTAPCIIVVHNMLKFWESADKYTRILFLNSVQALQCSQPILFLTLLWDSREGESSDISNDESSDVISILSSFYPVTHTLTIQIPQESHWFAFTFSMFKENVTQQIISSLKLLQSQSVKKPIPIKKLSSVTPQSEILDCLINQPRLVSLVSRTKPKGSNKPLDLKRVLLNVNQNKYKSVPELNDDLLEVCIDAENCVSDEDGYDLTTTRREAARFLRETLKKIDQNLSECSDTSDSGNKESDEMDTDQAEKNSMSTVNIPNDIDECLKCFAKQTWTMVKKVTAANADLLMVTIGKLAYEMFEEAIPKDLISLLLSVCRKYEKMVARSEDSSLVSMRPIWNEKILNNPVLVKSWATHLKERLVAVQAAILKAVNKNEIYSII
eukprot:GHVL01011151.1.p1 GENE.GHVL01011151.1~~GHVL01011151.1.p1  ORF type:complete len:941 (+),score=130.19 GHVL01011151.1:157-2979(+)